MRNVALVPSPRAAMRCAALAVTLLTAAPSRADAQPAGSFSIFGELELLPTAGPLAPIDFGPGRPPGVPGAFAVLGGATGDFAPLVGATGTILDIGAGALPAGTPLSIPGFLTFTAPAGFTVTLQELVPGTLAPCGPPPGGASCSPLNIQTVGGNSTLSFMVRGLVGDGALSSPITGSFSAALLGLDAQGVVDRLAGGVGVRASYAATFVAAVPEPSTASLLAVGVAAAALALRRRGRR